MKRALLLLLFSFPLHALTTSAITGRVIAGDAAAAGVTVTASSVVLQHPRTTISGPRGTYWLGDLPPGTYEVTFTRAGLTSLTRRAVVELGRVARADAALEPSEDEESVTSTATQTSVADTTAVTSHFDDATLDRFPGRDYTASVTPDPYSGGVTELDGAPAFLVGVAVPEESIEQVTVIRGAAPVEYESYGGKLAVIRTRSGREQLFVSLRDTISSSDWNSGGPSFPTEDGVQNFLDAHAGGRILPERLWFFGGLWGGDDATRFRRDERGAQLKLDAQLGAAHHLGARYIVAENRTGVGGIAEAWTAALHYSGAFGPRYTTETLVSRHTAALGFGPPPGGPIPVGPRDRADFLTSRASYVLPARHGDHVLTAGLSAWSGEAFEAHSFFLGDRWSSSRWVVNAGVRYDDVPFRGGGLTPRIAATYDLRGDGRRAISASFGDYAFGIASAPPVRIASLGYAAAIGNSGQMRVDVFRRGDDFDTGTTSLQLDARYRLFDRFELGATYTYTRLDDSFITPVQPDHVANAWAGLQLPIGAHEFGVTVLQRYFRFYNPGPGGIDEDTAFPTDVALRYAMPLSRFGLTFAVDAVNVFESAEPSLVRTVRFWTRLRM
jgi:Carboxypeptidase regulatory-like domain